MTPLKAPVQPRRSPPNRPLDIVHLPARAPASRIALPGAILILLTGFGLFLLQRLDPPAAKRAAPSGVRTASVRRGAVERTVRLPGMVGARKAQIVMAPKLPGNRSRYSGHADYMLTLEKAVKPGSLVRPGDFLAAFDRQRMELRLDDLRADVVQQRMSLERQRAQLAIRRGALQQRIRVAKANHEKALLNLKTAPVRSAIQAERFRLLAEEAEERHRQLLTEAGLAEISEAAVLRREQLRLEEAELDLRRAEGNLQRMSVAARIEGVTVMGTIQRGGEPHEIAPGDDLRAGHPFLSVVNLQSLIVEAAAGQMDVHKLRVGAAARVRLDAIPGLELAGRVEAVGAFARGNRSRGDYVRQIPVRIALEKTDPRLFPNASASADVVLESEEAPAVVPLECVFRGQSGGTRAYVQGSQGWEKREIELGLANHVEVAVRAGLQEGEIVAAEEPAPR